MTDSGASGRLPPRLTASRILLVTAIAACLCLAILALLQSMGTLQLQRLIFGWWTAPALLLHLASLALFIFAWQHLLGGHSTYLFGFRECAAQVGVTLTGKYLPGKIWGLLGRSYLLTRRGISRGNALHLLVADQFLTFYSGITMIGLGWLLIVAPLFAALAAALIAALSPILFSSYQGLASWLEQRPVLRRSATRAGAETAETAEPDAATSPATAVLRPNRLLRVAAIYAIHWLGLGLALALLFYPALADDFLRHSVFLVIAVPAGMLSGFVALWAPGGIGVREAVMIGVLGMSMSIELAAAVAIVYRLLCIGNDLLSGALALHFYSHHDPGLLGLATGGGNAR